MPDITTQERDALHALIALFSQADNRPQLDMRTACRDKASCGTAACIGGWMALILLDLHTTAPTQVLSLDTKLQVFDFVTKYGNGDLLPSSPALKILFYPPGANIEGQEDWWENITHQHAVQVIQSFLETGDPQYRVHCADIIPEHV